MLLLALVITNLMEGCQDEGPIDMLFVDDLVLICQTRKQANDKWELSRKKFEFHGVKISSIDKIYGGWQWAKLQTTDLLGVQLGWVGSDIASTQAQPTLYVGKPKPEANSNPSRNQTD